MNRLKAILITLFLGILLVTLSAEHASATVPTRMSYQGFLEDGGLPVTGSRNLYFVLFGTPAYQDSIWSEGHPSVTVDRGVFNVELGSIRPLTAAIANSAYLYLETRVNGTALSPRKRLDSVPYALVSMRADSAAYAENAAHAATADMATFAEHAAYADSAGVGGGGGIDPNWEAIGAIIHNLNHGNVGIGTSAPTRKLHVVTTSANPAVLIENGSGTGLNVTSAGAGGTAIVASAMGEGAAIWANGAGGVGVFGGADHLSGTTIGVSGYAAGPDGRGVYGQVVSTTGSSTGVLGEASSSTGYGVAGKNLATSGSGAGVYGTSAGTSGSGVYGSSTGSAGFGVIGSGASAGVFGTATNFSGRGVRGEGQGTGVYGAATGSGGWGVYGTASGLNGFGLFGSAASGTGVYGSGFTGGYFTTTGNSSSAHAVSVVSSSEDAAAVSIVASGVAATALYAEASNTGTLYGYGGYFLCASDDGTAVFGNATSSTGTGNSSYGGFFQSSGADGAGVYGRSDAAAGNAPGVQGAHMATANLGTGVRGDGNFRGVAGYTYGSDVSANHYGLYGYASGGTAGTNYGVYGFAGGGATHYAGYFSGDVHVTGTLSKAAGSFRIDHPLDPANKYLQHSFVESPDMMNVYNGNAILDGSGQATVLLPDYFETLNRDFRYQLTCVGGFAPVYVADKVNGNRFRIAGGTPGLEVSWQVTGIRQDAYAKAHPIQVEVDKPQMERGTYLHAVERGMPESMQTDRVLTGAPEPIAAPPVVKKDKKK